MCSYLVFGTQIIMMAMIAQIVGKKSDSNFNYEFQFTNYELS